MSGSKNKSEYDHAVGRVGTGAGIDWVYTDQTGGQMNYTGNKTDLAMFGDGYFNVLTPDGYRYTRAGNFNVNQNGYLVTQSGYYLAGQGLNNGRNPGPIYVGNEDFYINEQGMVMVNRPDQNKVNQSVVLDQIKVTDFVDKQKLFLEPGNVYRVEDEAGKSNIKIPENLRIGQGYIERSNSVPTTEMVKLIDSYRIHEASSRVVRALDQTLAKAVNEIARR